MAPAATPVTPALSGTRVWCCQQQTEIRVFITLFALINLGILAAGGVGFALGNKLDISARQ